MRQRKNKMSRTANGTVHPVPVHYKSRYIDCGLDNYKTYRSNAWRRLRKRLKRKGVVEVDLDHHRYKVLMSLRKGIRDVMLNHHPRQGCLDVDDFSQVEERHITRSDGRVFVFESYANNVFYHLRQSLDISESEFLESVAPESLPYLEFISNSNSGQKFYLSNDMKYMFKTEKECSIQFFFSILGDYLQHFQAYPHSLLVRFLGLYSIKLPKEKKIYFLVMQSVFYPCDRIQDRFDIKGFTTLRYQKPYHPNKNIVTVLKDKNFVDEVIDVGSQKSWFQKQLEIDVDFLRSLGVQDYSLLVGRQLQKTTRKQSSLSTIVRRVSRSLQPTAGFLPHAWASKTTSTTTLSHKSSSSTDPQHCLALRPSQEERRISGDPSRTPRTPRSVLSASELGDLSPPPQCKKTPREGLPETCVACQLAGKCQWGMETMSLHSSEMDLTDLRSDSCLECLSTEEEEEEEDDDSDPGMLEPCRGCSRDERQDGGVQATSGRTSVPGRSCCVPESFAVEGGSPAASENFPPSTEKSRPMAESSQSVLESPPPSSVQEGLPPAPGGVLGCGAEEAVEIKVGPVRQNGLVPSPEELTMADQGVVVEGGMLDRSRLDPGVKSAAERGRQTPSCGSQLAVPENSPRSGSRNSMVTSLMEASREPCDSASSSEMTAVESGHREPRRRSSSDFDAVPERDVAVDANSNHNNLHTVPLESGSRLERTLRKCGEDHCQSNSNPMTHRGSGIDTPNGMPLLCLNSGGAAPARTQAKEKKRASVHVHARRGSFGCRGCPRARTHWDPRRLSGRTSSGSGGRSLRPQSGPRPPRILLPYPQSLQVLENAQSENRRLLPACENALHIMDGPKYRYYLGIIDFFTRFECRQKVGSLFHCCKGIDLFYSSVDPEAYAHRFLRFIDDHLR